MHVLDEVSEACAERVSTLKLINVTRMPFEMLAISGFINLKVLCLSPHNLGDALVECLGDMKRLRNIQIITNKYTESVAPPVDYRVWKNVRKANPRLRVHLITEGGHRNEIVFQQRAPVKSIVYDSPYIPVSFFILSKIHFGNSSIFLRHQPWPSTLLWIYTKRIWNATLTSNYPDIKCLKAFTIVQIQPTCT